jgi:serine/threonine protein kinase
VRLGLHKLLNQKIAVKIYEKVKLLEPNRRKSVKREMKIMEKLDHPNIAKLYEVFESFKQVFMIMEYVNGGSLHGYLKMKPNRQMPELEAKFLWLQVVQAVQYCHQRNVAHRDIKLENLLLDETKTHLKLIDFGFSTCIPHERKVKIFCGTPSYMAPEIVSKIEYSGPPADIWAMGVLLYALLCGKFPFKGANDKELYSQICSSELQFPDHVSAQARKFLKKLF